MVDKYRITYDSNKEDAFSVHLEDGVVKFTRTNEGLYAYKPTKKYLKEVAQTKSLLPPIDEEDEDQVANEESKAVEFLASTIEENMEGYTQRQREDAKRARRLYYIIGCPTVGNFKHIMRQNIIKNCPVTVDDVNIAEKIYGPDIRSLKGKTTRHKPLRVKEDRVEIPPEILKKYKDLTYCMDIMFINGIPMLTGIDRSIRFRSLVPLNDRSAKELYKGWTRL